MVFIYLENAVAPLEKNDETRSRHQRTAAKDWLAPTRVVRVNTGIVASETKPRGWE